MVRPPSRTPASLNSTADPPPVASAEAGSGIGSGQGPGVGRSRLVEVQVRSRVGNDTHNLPLVPQAADPSDISAKLPVRTTAGGRFLVRRRGRRSDARCTLSTVRIPLLLSLIHISEPT